MDLNGDGIKSIKIALRLMDAIASSDGPMPLKHIAEKSEVSPSKAHRYLKSLCAIGLLSQTRKSGRYDLGPQLLRLGLLAANRVDVVALASERLAELSSSIGVDCILSVWCEAGPTIVRYERSSGRSAANLGPGANFPLITSATGQIYLTFANRAVTTDLLVRQLPEGGDLVESFERIREIVVKTRESGYAVSTGSFIEGNICVAAPILSFDDHVVAAVTAIMPTASPDPHIIAAVLEFCARFSSGRRADQTEPDMRMAG